MSSSEHPAVYETAKLTFALNGRNPNKYVNQFEIATLLKNIDRLGEWFKQWEDVEVLFFPHITWGRGTVLPYWAIAQAWKHTQNGTMKFVIVDGAHSLGHINVDLEPDGSPDVPFDFYATCGHKWLAGPQGTGILYVAQHLMEIPFVNLRNKMLDSFSLYQERGQSATGQRAIACGLFEACREFCGTDPDSSGDDLWEQTAGERHKKILSLTEYLRKKLGPLVNRRKIRFVLPENQRVVRTGITAFSVPSLSDYPSLKNKLEEKGFRVTHVNVMKPRFQAIRICTSYNMEFSDVDDFVTALDESLSEPIV